MMPNRSVDILFKLVHSFKKSEKRHFKLYIKRNSQTNELKIVQLFDAIAALGQYDEKLLLKKLKDIQKPQLANLKTHLYKQLLASLRLLKSSESLDLQLNEQFDYAHILYKKGLYQQSLRILDRVKEMAKNNQKYVFLTQVIALEKRIEGLHISDTDTGRVTTLTREANEVSEHISIVTRLSNLALLLFDCFTKHGHARNAKDEAGVKKFLQENLPPNAHQLTGFYERMYLYQSYCWYAFIRQDFLQYYRYAVKWIDLFDNDPRMIKVETSHYIKGLHYLLNAHFDLRNYRGFSKALQKFEGVSLTERVTQNDNFRIQAFVYISTAKINQHTMQGSFAEGLKLIPEIMAQLEKNELFLDLHHIMVIHYKIATLYFGSGNYSTCIDYLQKIIDESGSIRTDLQCYARLLHLMAHYELGNTELMDPLSRSAYRFMAKMENLTVVEQEMFRFLKKSFSFTRLHFKPELLLLLEKIKHLEKNRFETRSFAYFDIIAWLEGKATNKPMSAIIHAKYLESKRK